MPSMNISETIHAYKDMLMNPSKLRESVYFDRFGKLHSKDKNLAIKIQARIAAEIEIQGGEMPDTPITKIARMRNEMYLQKSAVDADVIADAIVLISKIKCDESERMRPYLPILREIVSNRDIYLSCGSCPREIVRGLKRCLQAGVLH